MEVNRFVLSPIPLEEFEKRISSIIASKLAEKSSDRNRFISIRKAVQSYDVSKATLYNWNKQGIINIHPLQGKSFINIDELEEAIQKGGHQ